MAAFIAAIISRSVPSLEIGNALKQGFHIYGKISLKTGVQIYYSFTTSSMTMMTGNEDHNITSANVTFFKISVEIAMYVVIKRLILCQQ